MVVYHVQGHRTTGLGICATHCTILLGVWIQTMGHDPEDMENERLRGHDHELAQEIDDGGS